MYGVLSTKLLWTFFKRNADPSQGGPQISRTFNAHHESVGPVLLYLAAMAVDQAPIPRAGYPDTSPDSKWLPSKRQRAAASEAPAAPDSSANPGDDDDGSEPDGYDEASPDDGSSEGQPARQPQGRPSSVRQSRKRARSASAGGSRRKRCQLAYFDHTKLDLGETCYHGKHFLVILLSDDHLVDTA